MVWRIHLPPVDRKILVVPILSRTLDVDICIHPTCEEKYCEENPASENLTYQIIEFKASQLTVKLTSARAI